MKVVVIGAGPSGLSSAIYARKNGNDVTILERNNDILKKLLITGNGKCNYFNDDQSITHYHSSNKDLIDKIITKENLDDMLLFFDELGIVPKVKNGYYYPYSNQASSVKSMLYTLSESLGINIINNYLVTDIEYKNNNFIINDDITCDVLILSTGSKAYPKLGSTGIGYDLVKKFNHSINEVMPALVSLKSDDKYLKELKGVRCDAKLSIYENDNYLSSSMGELQLTDYGLSGICTFDLSYLAVKSLYNNNDVHIKVNFIPFIQNKEELIKYLDNRAKKIDNKCTMNKFFDGLLNYKLSSVILKKCNILGSSYYKDLSFKEKELLITTINSYDFKIISSNSFDNSQVCQGGVPLNEINLSTMESLKKKNLYIVGEMLDVNGDCGGYNLTFAFISGLMAGKSIK